MITVVDLFAGMGGLSMGAQHAGLAVTRAYELNVTACGLYERAAGKHIEQADLRAFNPRQLPDSDGIIGGPPCQAFSQAGRGEGSESALNMWPETLRIVNEKRPSWFCFENVPALVMSKHRWYFNRLMQAFDDMGYTVDYRVLNAADYGVPQTRKRVFIVGRRDGVPIRWPLPTHYRDGIPGDVRFPRWVSWFEALTGWLADSPQPDKLPKWVMDKYQQRGWFHDLPCDGYFPGQEARHDRQHRERWQPAYTVVASAHNRCRVMVDGVVYHADARALATLQCLPPIALTSEPIGNAVPPPLAKRVLEQFA